MRIGALVPIRLASERLPGKALIKICNRPMCFHLLDRVLASKFIDDPKNIVVCTTCDASDDELIAPIEAYGCSIFRGATDDIIRRFSDAMAAFDLDYVIQADGDDPLSATEYMDQTMDTLLKNTDVDIVTIKGLPLGCATKSFSRNAMSKVMAAYKTKKNDTGFIYFFTKSGLCQHLEIVCKDPAHQNSEARLTLDYPADLRVFKAIFEECYVPREKPASLATIIDFLEKNPELIKENQHVEKEYWQRTAERAQLEYRDADGNLESIKV